VNAAPVLLAVLAGPLAAAGLAKRFGVGRRSAWPVRTGPLRLPYGPRLVGAVEFAAAVAITLAPTRVAAIVAVVVYAALAETARRYRGRECGCFGAARLAVLGPGHTAVNTLAALAAGVLLVLAPVGGNDVRLRSAVAVASTLATVAAVRLLARDAAGALRLRTAHACARPVGRVQLYLSATCPSCTALEHLLDGIEPARRAAIDVHRVTVAAPVPAHLRHLGVPCAVAQSPAGTPVCAPVSGLGEVRRLITGVVMPGPHA
jgi:hypothetical protein